MKPTMMFAIIMATAIIMMSAFDLTLAPTKAIELAPEAAANALYVCPATNETWDMLADGFSQFNKPLFIGFLFALIILLFTWLWALYQNLLKDKFVRDAFKTPWAFTKLMFWAVIIVLMLVNTPNHYRSVRVSGTNTDWVLCESNTPGAMAVRETSVTP